MRWVRKLGQRASWAGILAFGVLRSKRRPILIALGILLVGLSVAATVPVLTGRTSPPEYARQAANHAYEQAQRQGGARWAARELAAAQKLLDQGFFEYRRQAARLLPFRNFGDARLILAQAEARGWEAAKAAVAKRRSAKETAEQHLERATELAAIGRGFGIVMPLSPYERTLLARSLLRLTEAKMSVADGEFVSGAALAAEAESLAGRVSAACSERAGRYADTRLLEHWRRMIDETIAWSRRTGEPAVLVSKAAHSMTLYRAGIAKRTYHADIGRNSVADKTIAGDHATPEGKYRIVAKKDIGQSQYHRALLLDYPSAEDLELFRKLRKSGKIRSTGPGGQIEIHGEGGRQKDWTRGCVAIANAEMDELFKAVSVGTPVVIVGSHGDGGPFVDLVERYQAATGGALP